MPYAANQGVRIYYEVEGSGPPLLMQHGWAGSTANWRVNGFVAALAPHCRLILMDARGHGRSDKPYDSKDYTMALRAADACAVLDALDVEKVNFLGYSMGGRIGYGFAQHRQERLNTLIIGGAGARAPIEYEAEKHRNTVRMLRERGLREVFESRMPGASEEQLQARIAINDAQALAAERYSLLEWEGMDPATIAVPTLIYAGSEDAYFPLAKESAARIPHCRFVELTGMVHVQAGRAPEVPPLILGWLREQGVF